MALLGQAVLAIWNGMKPGTEEDFVAWHVREHIPERVGLPGFLRGRRYVALDGHPKYFNFYETETLADLTSPLYRERLNTPSSWTRQVVAQFTDTSRTLCDVAASVGRGSGAWIETLRLRGSGEAASFRASVTALMEGAHAQPGIVALHLLEGQPPEEAGGTVEKQLRGQPDAVADWILLVEAVESDAALALRNGLLDDASLTAIGAGTPIERGLYRLQFGLTKAEIERG